MAAKSRKPFFERLKTGLAEGIAHARGEVTLKTIELPEVPPEFDAATLATLRREARMSQGVFARLLSVSSKTVQSWEQGVRAPSQACRRLLHIFTEQPGIVCRVVGVPVVELSGFTLVQTKGGKRRIIHDPRSG